MSSAWSFRPSSWPPSRDDADLVISATNDDIRLQWTDGDELWTYKLEGPVLEAFRMDSPDIKERLEDALIAAF